MSDSNNPNGAATDAGEMSQADMASLISQSIGATEEDSHEEQASEDAQANEQQTDDVPDDELAFLYEDDDESDGEEASGEDEQPGEDDEANQPFELSNDAKFIVNGKELTGAEIQSGLMATADYTRKTQELSSQRKETEATMQRYKEAEDKAIQQAQMAEEVLSSLVPAMPDPEMLNPQSDKYDIVGYQRAQAQHQQWAKYFDDTKGQFEEIRQQAQKESIEQANKFRQSELQAFQEKVPHMKEPAKMGKFFDAAGTLLSTKYGIPAERLGNIPNHEFWVIAKDLLKLDKIEQKRMAAVRKGKGKQRVATSGTRQAAGAATPADGQLNKRLQRNQKSGKANDAVLAKALGQKILSR